jgi:hypothetical protein
MAESPVPAAESDTTQVNITWDAILKVLDGCVPVGTLRLLADETQVTASVQGRELLLTVNQGFAMNKLNKPGVQAMLRDCAAKLTAGPVKVRIEEAKPREADAGKLDELKRFGNVTIK